MIHGLEVSNHCASAHHGDSLYRYHSLVAHGSEIAYVYGSVLLDGTPFQVNTSLAMMDYWTSFATSLDPNDGRGAVPSMYQHACEALKLIIVAEAHWRQYDLQDPVRTAQYFTCAAQTHDSSSFTASSPDRTKHQSHFGRLSLDGYRLHHITASAVRSVETDHTRRGPRNCRFDN